VFHAKALNRRKGAKIVDDASQAIDRLARQSLDIGQPLCAFSSA